MSITIHSEGKDHGRVILEVTQAAGRAYGGLFLLGIMINEDDTLSCDAWPFDEAACRSYLEQAEEVLAEHMREVHGEDFETVGMSPDLDGQGLGEMLNEALGDLGVNGFATPVDGVPEPDRYQSP